MMMRKLCLVAALTAAMTGFSAANAAAQLKDGTWTGAVSYTHLTLPTT